MKDTKQAGQQPEEKAEESTKGFPIVTEEQNDSTFEMKKKNSDGSWTAAAPVSVSGETKKKEVAEEKTEEATAETEELKKPEEEDETEEPTVPAEDEPTVPADDEPAPTEQLHSEQPEAEKEPAPTEKLQAQQPKQETAKPAKKKSVGKRVAAIVAGVAVIAVVGLSAFVYAYPNIFPGVRVAHEYKLSGMTQDEAQAYLAGDVQNALYDTEITVTAKDLGTDTDKEYKLKVSDMADSMDSESAAQAAYLIGREGNYFQRVGTVLNSMVTGWNISTGSSLKDGTVEEKVDEIQKDLTYDPVQPSWKVDEDAQKLVVDTGKQGLTFDHDRVVQELSDRVSGMDFEPYTIETSAVDQNKPDAAEIAKDVNKDPQNASVDKEDGSTILEAVNGVKVEESAIQSAIGDASEQTYEIPIELTKAKVTKADLEPVLFRDTLASVTTYYSGSGGRTTNVRLAANSVDETIVNPGEEFSYNDTVGERTAARGYRGAIVYNNGQEVTELGGGVCQVSSTVYMTVLRADLEVTERSCHQFQVTYTPLSQDAAVYWGSKDFKFVNSTDYPIKIRMSAGGGSLTCQIIGTKTAEDEGKEISFYATSSSGSRGKSASLYKKVTVNGETTTTKVNDSYYMYH